MSNNGYQKYYGIRAKKRGTEYLFFLSQDILIGRLLLKPDGRADLDRETARAIIRALEKRWGLQGR